MPEAGEALRILHVIPSLAANTGGPAFNTVNLARTLQAAGHVVAIFTTDAVTPAQGRQRLGGASLHDFPPGAREVGVQVFPIQHPYRLTYSSALGRALNDQARSFDVIHIHSLNLFPQFAAWRAAQRSNVPYVVSPRGALDPWLRQRHRLRKMVNDALWQRRMLDGAAALHLTSDDERRLIQPMGIRAPHVVIPNGFDVASFARPANPAAFRRRWLGGYEGPLILNHGRLSEKKGLDILVDAVARLPSDQPWHLALVGADDEGIGARLEAQANRLGIRNRLTLVPPLSGDELLNAIQAADVWVLPSHTENFGMAVVEAMAAGRPVITSPHVNIAPEAAAEGALMMVPNRPPELAEALLELLRDCGRQGLLGQRGQTYVSKFDWSVLRSQFVELYALCVARSQVSPSMTVC